MVDVNKLKGKMVEKGYSNKKMADMLGIHKDTFGRKLRMGKFGTDEAEKMIRILNIDNPTEIFFAKKVT